MSGISLVAILALPGVAHVLVRNIPLGHYGIYGTLFKLRLQVSLFSSVGFITFSLISFENLTILDLCSLGAIAVLLPIFYCSQMYEHAYQAQMQFRELSGIYVGRTALQLASFVLAFSAMRSVFPAFAFMICSMTAYHFWNHQRMARSLAVKAAEVRTAAPILNRDAIMLSLFGALPVLMENADKIIGERAIGLEALAVYTVGMTFGIAINDFFKPFLTSINAKLVHRTPMLQHYAIIGIGGTIAGVTLVFVYPYLLPFLYGEDYIASAPIASIVSASLGLFYCKTLFSNHAVFNKDQKLKVVYASNTTQAIGVIGYIFSATLLVTDHETLLLCLALAYPLKMALSILFVQFWRRALN